MRFFEFILQDWDVNKLSSKGKKIMILFRIANFCSNRKIYYYIGYPYLVFYKFVVEWVFSIEIPRNVKIGKNLKLCHGQGLVINSNLIIEDNCTLRHNTTIGNKTRSDGTFSGCPVIGNNVDIGSNVCIVGEILIGNNVKIGTGAVVVKSVPDDCTAIGNPAIIKSN
jgi:putative colanic acid biosynthesis acetyltransferase WcaB